MAIQIPDRNITMKTKSSLLWAALLGAAFITTLHAQSSAFTYQGRLDTEGEPYTGLAEMQFSLWTAATGGSQVGSTLTLAPVGVTNGLFTATLDFGNQFPGANRWLELAVRTNLLSFSTLLPRQPLTSTPYSVTAGNLTGTLPARQVSGSLATATLPTSGNWALTGLLTVDGNIVAINPTANRVGIGTTSPARTLHVQDPGLQTGSIQVGGTFSSLADRLIYFGDSSFVSVGESGADDRMELSAHTFVFKASRGNGNVGIGTTNPAQAKLVVSGTATDSVGNHAAYVSDGSIIVSTAGPYSLNDVSIKASHAIHANWFRAVSDARIKNIRGRSDGATDLATLATIEIVDYTHKDKMGRCNQPQKKVIGQQVEAVFPQAVSGPPTWCRTSTNARQSKTAG